VEPGWHVPEHPHANMEIFGYVVQGHCRHTDSFGNSIDIPAGAVQRMSAGTGLRHTEGNAGTEQCRYLQLWILPNQQNVEPRWSWHQFSRKDKLNKFCDVTEQLPIYADARLLSGIFTEDFTYTIDPSRSYYMYIVTGSGENYIEGDGFMYEQESVVEIKPSVESEIILFELRAQ
jgi:redox-sensitive bicupin YhaK (pirin superfamily)